MSLFVTFEGPDGSGKSTQLGLAAEELRRQSFRIVTTREPGGTPLGERIRDLLLGSEQYAIVPRTEALLMTAARAQHVHDVIRPALSDGAIVLCDRYLDSTLAYQGAGRCLSLEELVRLQEFAVGECRPDLTILLDLPADQGLLRLQNSGTPLNRLDQDELAFHERVRDWYREAARLEPGRWAVFDAALPPEELSPMIVREILDRAGNSTRSAQQGGATR